MIKISLNQIRKYRPCELGWEKLLTHLGKTKADNEKFSFSTIIDSNGLSDAVWALRCLEDKTPAQLFAIACAQEVLHLMQDQRSIEVIKVAHLFLHGEAGKEELADATIDAVDAAYAVDAYAADAAYAATYAATYAADAYAATYAANAYAVDAAYAAAAYAADAADAYAVDAADATMKAQQKAWLRAIVDNY